MSDESGRKEDDREYYQRRLDRLGSFIAWFAALSIGIGCYLYLTYMFRMQVGIAALVSLCVGAFSGYYFRERLNW